MRLFRCGTISCQQKMLTIEPATFLALFGILLTGALLPGLSVLTVTSRTLSFGWRHGVATTAGIVSGDVLFIIVALFGLRLVQEALGGHVIYLRYAGAVYLALLGLGMWRARAGGADPEQPGASSLLASYMAGLLLTLADQKAILFYLAALPALLAVQRFTLADAGVLIVLAILTVGGAKLAYALLAVQARGLFRHPALIRSLQRLAGTVLVSVGLYLLLSA